MLLTEAMVHVVLYNPVIPQNTGSIARLCAGTGASLHLIHPLGFETSDAAVRRAGLDYWDHVRVTQHENWERFLETESPQSLFFFSKFSMTPYTQGRFTPPCYLVLGSETKGLPSQLHVEYPGRFFHIPMRTSLVRSLNLAQCSAIVVYEALRQNEFRGV